MKALLVAVVAVLSGGAVAGADGGAGAVARAAGKGATEMSVVAAGLGAGVSKVAAGTARNWTPSPVTDNMKVRSNTVMVSTALPMKDKRRAEPGKRALGSPLL